MQLPHDFARPSSFDSITFDRVCGTNNDEEDFEELLGALTHHLRNRLGAIQMCAQLLNDRACKGTDIPMQRMSRNILDASEDISSFANRFLSNASARNGDGFCLERLSLTDAVASTIGRYTNSAESKSITFHGEFPSEPAVVFADHDALEQVIDNLVSNALKFSPRERGIWVSVSIEKNGMLECRVRDEGPGCDKLDQAGMFKRFHCLSAKPTAGEPSSGLGLNIAKRNMDSMHGTLHCESESGHGATFIFRLPVAA